MTSCIGIVYSDQNHMCAKFGVHKIYDFKCNIEAKIFTCDFGTWK